MLGRLQSLLLKQTVPVIYVSGPIMQDSGNKIQKALDKINPHTAKALAVVVNSPGGLPVQSDIICTKIKQFTQKHHLPLYTFAEDLAASGGYFVLCIGDKVFADSNSLVGSVGVVGGWMGFQQWLKYFNVENRSFTSNKNSLRYHFDPLKEFNEQSADVVRDMLKKTHLNFMDHIETYRKLKIKVPEQDRPKLVYNADVFTGQKAYDLGLIDDIGLFRDVLAKLHPGCKIQIVRGESKLQSLRQYMTKLEGFPWLNQLQKLKL